MCGIVGYIDMNGERRADEQTLADMMRAIRHRGPDESGYFIDGSFGFGFQRLSIIDPAGGRQPMQNEDGSVVVVCNGEVFNYVELRERMIEKGHQFQTGCDIEVIPHLYEEYGIGLVDKLNGQFSMALFDRARQKLFIARDPFGITPMHYAVAGGTLIFGSEVKAILQHPLADREVDLTGLDQILSFPGLVSPRTMFKGVHSLKGGHYLTLERGSLEVKGYWDLDYPRVGEFEYDKPDRYYIEGLRDLLARAVDYRLQADAPVGVYLSGGLDSSLIAAMMKRAAPGKDLHTFSIAFADHSISEQKYQRLMVGQICSTHHEVTFDRMAIADGLRPVVYHCECPVKETYNTCSKALAQTARENGIKVILGGEGADELFGGYPGYRFDRLREGAAREYDLDTILEDEMRRRLWGDCDIFYEKNYHAHGETRAALYSNEVNAMFNEIDCLSAGDLIDRQKLEGRHRLHQRSYLDVKLRLSDHLLGDHGDRMALAHSVEGRYPFLDRDFVEFARQVPPRLKLHQFSEKYALKKAAAGLVPREIISREKHGFRAPGSPQLLRQNIEWIDDLLSYERIRRQGYFNPDTVERIKAEYSRPGYELNPHVEDDLLLLVITTGIFLDSFDMPDLR
ncbi:MAG: asparagine synthase (glutamine-hydrolyzing) [Blastocatellia bacterium]